MVGTRVWLRSLSVRTGTVVLRCPQLHMRREKVVSGYNKRRLTHVLRIPLDSPPTVSAPVYKIFDVYYAYFDRMLNILMP